METSTISEDTEQTILIQDEQEDIWKFVLDLGPANADVKFYTWEAFLQPTHEEPRSAYISEAGPGAFDAALQAKAQARGASKTAGSILRSDVLLRSLLALGLGQSSVLFTYDEKRKAFIQAIEDGRMSGYSMECSQSLVKRFLGSGTTIRRLKGFVEKTYASSTSYPALVALASAVSAALSALECHVNTVSQSVRSLLQLQHLFDKPHQILALIESTVDRVKAAKSDQELASVLYRRLESVDQERDWHRAILLRILARVSRPWLDFVGEWIGLHQERGPVVSRVGQSATFVQPDESLQNDDTDLNTQEYTYNPAHMPAFVAEDDGRMIFGMGQSLRLLKSHHQEHPLAEPEALGIVVPNLEWNFAWEDMESVAAKAKGYEDSLTAAVKQFERGRTTLSSKHVEPDRLHLPAVEKVASDQSDQAEQYIVESIAALDSLPSGNAALPDELYQLVILNLASDAIDSATDSATFAPPLSLTATLSFTPLLTAQARLVNAASMRLLFRSHHLRTHFSLQRNYHLLGDGVFTSRLATALFSPDLASAERRRGVVRTGTPMGLKLGSRSIWPPASSELRLALMGLLSESYHSSELYRSLRNQKDYHNGHRGKEFTELPGNLSFAIRTLSSTDAERCMDPNSLHALDFLRLQYNPPSPVHAVITPASLEKYDTIFRFLLRLTRMLFVVSHLPRGLANPQARRCRIEAHHFVVSCAAYFFETGVNETWGAFSSYLDDIERRLGLEDDAGDLGKRVGEGIESLRGAHEACLDQILFTLLLRKRQQQVMALLEEIFDLILLFDQQVAKGGLDNVSTLYERFRSKLSVFLNVCRGLVSKKGYGKGRASVHSGARQHVMGGENSIERLLLTLEVSGYCSMRDVSDKDGG